MPDQDDEPHRPPSTAPNIKPNSIRYYARPADLMEQGVNAASKRKLTRLSALLQRLAALKQKN
jgi:hypothetical protein